MIGEGCLRENGCGGQNENRHGTKEKMGHKLSTNRQSERKEEMSVIQCPVDGQKRQHYVIEPSKSVCELRKEQPSEAKA